MIHFIKSLYYIYIYHILSYIYNYERFYKKHYLEFISNKSL